MIIIKLNKRWKYIIIKNKDKLLANPYKIIYI